MCDQASCLIVVVLEALSRPFTFEARPRELSAKSMLRAARRTRCSMQLRPERFARHHRELSDDIGSRNRVNHVET